MENKRKKVPNSEIQKIIMLWRHVGFIFVCNKQFFAVVTVQIHLYFSGFYAESFPSVVRKKHFFMFEIASFY